MVILHVTLQVKPEHVSEFLEIARYDAEHSKKDEPGCLRFDVSRDQSDPNRFYFYEVYRDEAAHEAHRRTPHFRLYAEKTKDWLTASPERRWGKNVVPADADWR